MFPTTIDDWWLPFLSSIFNLLFSRVVSFEKQLAMVSEQTVCRREGTGVYDGMGSRSSHGGRGADQSRPATAELETPAELRIHFQSRARRTTLMNWWCDRGIKAQSSPRLCFALLYFVLLKGLNRCLRSLVERCRRKQTRVPVYDSPPHCLRGKVERIYVYI